MVTIIGEATRVEDRVSDEEIVRRRKILDDYLRMASHIPPDLQAKLESLLTPELKGPLMELLLFSIQFGRVLQNNDHTDALQQKPLIVMPNGKAPSKLLMSLVEGLKH